MTNLTSLEKIVLLAFNTYGTAEDTKADLGVSWTDAAMLATETSLEVNTVKGVLGSLVKKGLVYSDHESGQPAAVCLTEDGADALFKIDADGTMFVDDPEARIQDEEGQAPLAAETEEEAALEAFIKAGADEEVAKAMGTPFPGIICATLRHFASKWEGPRKTFIKTAQLAGFKKATAATQWQRARKGG